MTWMDARYNPPHRLPPPDDDEPLNERWHVDKGIPLALIVTLTLSALTSSAGAIVYISRIDSRLGVVERVIEGNGLLNENIVRLSEKVANLERVQERTLSEIRDLLRRDRADNSKTDRMMERPL